MKNLIFILCLIFVWKFSNTNTLVAQKNQKETTVVNVIDTLNDVDSAKLKSDYVFTRHIYNSKFNKDLMNFIERFDYVAILEKKKYGILPSIKLGQAILESGYGKSKLAKECNAFFGIKKNDTNRSKKYITHEIVKSKKITIEADFNCFDIPWESFRNHSILLTKKRYKKVREAKNYKIATRELKKAGYFTSNTAERNLNFIIKKYKLYLYDKL